jgi:hypothetical protein
MLDSNLMRYPHLRAVGFAEIPIMTSPSIPEAQIRPNILWWGGRDREREKPLTPKVGRAIFKGKSAR